MLGERIPNSNLGGRTFEVNHDAVDCAVAAQQHFCEFCCGSHIQRHVWRIKDLNTLFLSQHNTFVCNFAHLNEPQILEGRLHM